jgi:hypothetical protein
MAKTKIIPLNNGYCVAKHGKTGFKIVNSYGDEYGYTFTKSDLNTIKKKQALMEKRQELIDQAKKLHNKAYDLEEQAGSIEVNTGTQIGSSKHELLVYNDEVKVGCTTLSNATLAKIERF